MSTSAHLTKTCGGRVQALYDLSLEKVKVRSRGLQSSGAYSSVHGVQTPPGQAPAGQGAQTCINLAPSPEVEGVSGKYFVNLKAIRSSKASYDQSAADRPWQVSAEMCGFSLDRKSGG
ncbi:MAG: hypothetical protein ABIJ39_11705 [Chloroflexota bacterium]